MSDKVFGADNQQERLLVLPADYIVGLVDGEGYFSVSVTTDNSKNYLSRRVRLVFGVKLKEADGGILYRVRKTFGCGRIYKKPDNRPTFSDCLEYQVRDYADIRDKIVPFFRRHTLQMKSKRSSFERFCIIAKLFEQKVHLTKDGFENVKNLARNVHK